MSHRYRLSISTRLTLWYGLTLAVLLSLFAVFCYASFHRGLHRDFDFHLAHETRVLLPRVETGPGGPSPGDMDQLESVAIRTGGALGTYVRLFDAAGRERYRSPNFEQQGPLPPLRPGAEKTRGLTWDGLPARSAYTPLFHDGQPIGWMEVTGFEWSLHQELHRLGETLALGILLSLALALGGGYLLARRALRPVAALTLSASRIEARALGARLPTDFGVHDELTDLAETFNGMLARIEASVERERRFTMNAAHELMTPVATLRSEAEVALRRERSADAYRGALTNVLGLTAEMEAVVGAMLALARSEGANQNAAEHVDLGTLVCRHAERFRARAQERGIAFSVEAPAGIAVLGTPVTLGMVAENLVDNAIKYTPPGGRVRVEVRDEGTRVTLVVEDTGIGFPADAADRLFDRFYRADHAAVQAEQGNGLGLAITYAIVEQMGGRLTAHSAGEGLGSRFEAQMPKA